MGKAPFPFTETEKPTDELLGGYISPSGRPAEKTEQVITLIREMLSDGEEHKASECEAKLCEANISSSTAKKAKATAGAVSTKRRSGWSWSLPECGDELPF